MQEAPKTTHRTEPESICLDTPTMPIETNIIGLIRDELGHIREQQTDSHKHFTQEFRITNEKLDKINSTSAEQSTGIALLKRELQEIASRRGAMAGVLGSIIIAVIVAVVKNYT